MKPAYFVRVEPSIAQPFRFVSYVLFGEYRESCAASKGGFWTIAAAETWGEAKKRRLEREVMAAEGSYEPDVLFGNASLWQQGNEWEDLRDGS